MKWFVYVIWARDEDGEEVRYYGHTHDMKQRKYTHMHSHKKWVNAYRPDNVTSSVYVLDMENWNMDVLHELDCDEEEASRVEGNYIRYNKCVNRRVAGRTRQQHHQDNRDVLNAGRKQRYQANRQTNISKKAEKVQCPCGALISRSNMAEHLKTQKHAKRMQQSTSSS